MNHISLKKTEFKKLSKLVYSQFGINLTDDKFALVESRLVKTLLTEGMNSFSEFYDWVINDPSKEGLSVLIDKVSTNHTYFYREVDHFHFMETRLNEFDELATQDPLNEFRIWSAGCSYGDEPYTYAMVLMEQMELKGIYFNFKILATDISQDAIENAETGLYKIDRVKGLPKTFLRKYLHKVDSEHYKVNDEVKQKILFRRFNLMNTTFPFKKKFHLISCRNVMIYFDKPTKETLAEQFYKHLNPDGILFIGHSESLGNSLPFFKVMQPAIYKPTWSQIWQ